MDAHLIASFMVGLVTMLVGAVVKLAVTGAKADIISHQNTIRDELKTQASETQKQLEVHKAEDAGNFAQLSANDKRHEDSLSRIEGRLNNAAHA